MPCAQSKALTSEEEVTGVSADGERSSERLHPMQLSDYTSAVARNKHVFNKLRSAQFRVETRKRMIQMELNSYLEQYDEGFLGRSAVMMLMHELEHQSDHHRMPIQKTCAAQRFLICQLPFCSLGKAENT